MNIMPEYCKDIKIDGDTLLLLCDNDADATRLINSIKRIDIDCYTDCDTPIMTIKITYNDLKRAVYQYNNIALIWKECKDITSCAVEISASSTLGAQRFPLSP